MAVCLILGRVLLGLSVSFDGGWWLYTWDVRAAYLDQVGLPSFVIVPIALVYLACGLLVAVGRAVRPAVLPLVAVAGLISMGLHTDLGPGGVGEYPLDRHAQMNSEALLAQVTLVGALMLAFGAPSLRTPIDLRAVVLGRVLIGVYFVVNALLIAYDYDARIDAVGTLLPTAIATQIVFGMLLAAGRALRGSVMALALILVVTTVAVHGDLSPGAAFPPNAQIHQWFVRGSILAGLLMLLGLGPIATPPPRPRELPPAA